METKIAEDDALLLSETRFKALYDEMPVGIFVWKLVDFHDPSCLRLFYANTAAEQLSGAPVKTFVGLSMLEAFPDFLSTEIPEKFLQCFKANKKMDLGRLTYGDKHIVFSTYSVNVFPLVDEECVVAVFENIAEQEKIKLAFQESKQQLHAILENLPVAIGYLDSQERIHFGNKRYQRLYGISECDYGKVFIKDLVSQEYYEKIKPYMREVLAGRKVSFEGEVPDPEDGQHPAYKYYVPQFNQAGEVEGVYALISDIAELKAIEEALRESEKQYRSIYEASWDGIAVTDSNGYFLACNPAYHVMHGYKDGELIGQHVSVLIPEAYYYKTKEFDEQLERLGRAEITTMAVTKNDKKTFPVEVIGIPFAYEGQPSVLAIVRDLTKIKETDRKLQQQQTELSHMLRLATLGEMATGLAHELNQPLTSIASYTQGCIERLRVGSLSSENFTNILGRIAAQTKRAASIVQSVRNFVKKEESTRECIGLERLINESLAFFDIQLEKMQASVELSLQDNLPDILVNKGQLQQVIVNVLTNAIESVSEFEVSRRRVIISVEFQAGDVLIAVRDFGQGIAGVDLSKIFTPFYTAKANGLGMGLAICHSIVEAHGGRIAIDGNFEQGVCVSVTLPVCQGEESE